MRKAYRERISDLKDKRKSAGNELEKLQATGKDAWEDRRYSFVSTRPFSMA